MRIEQRDPRSMLNHVPKTIITHLKITNLLLWLLAALTVQANAQSAGATQTAKVNNPLEHLAPIEIESLDVQLSAALDHYYADQHHLALPHFIELARKAPTQEILFRLGTSAAKTAKWKTAAGAYQQILAMDPDIQRARLELGMVYFHQGSYREAREAFERVLASDPPPTVRGNIEQLLRVIDHRTQKWFGGLNLSQHVHWNSNPNAGASTVTCVACPGKRPNPRSS